MKIFDSFFQPKELPKKKKVNDESNVTFRFENTISVKGKGGREC